MKIVDKKYPIMEEQNSLDKSVITSNVVKTEWWKPNTLKDPSKMSHLSIHKTGPTLTTLIDIIANNKFGNQESE